MKYAKTFVVAVVAAITLVTGVALAHEMTVQGTVVAVEATRVQIKSGKEKAGASAEWYPIDVKTKIKRGTKSVTFAEAKIAVNERVVAIVDHPTKGDREIDEFLKGSSSATPKKGGHIHK
jgi:hypothetical protein